MAEIPVERKEGGIPWWVWLVLAAIVAALLIWWATSDDDRDRDRAEPVGVEATEPVTTDPVTTQ